MERLMRGEDIVKLYREILDGVSDDRVALSLTIAAIQAQGTETAGTRIGNGLKDGLLRQGRGI
jgi:hypothetical protein